ncbi:A-kinase anchor protein 10, mitochondrial isoform X1 [Prorops nasuta]|uniref:A-kinase anchor protein 10, mitochondrial isoform X1 n=1 Tax=Prorops nasuta TaxID=863751 RepID=UPI0034CE90D6
MFQFFRKAGQRDRSGSLLTLPDKSLDFGKLTNVLQSHVHAPPGELCSFEEEEEDGNQDPKREAFTFRSQLSKTLLEILSDKSALGYFIQFMETKNSIALIKFWIEVECLRGASLTEECGERINSSTDSNLKKDTSTVKNILNNNESCVGKVLNNRIDYDNKATLLNQHVYTNVNSNCTIAPKNSQSVREKRQSDVTSGNKKRDITTTRQDAIRIYKKYIAKQALGTNVIPEELKIDIEIAMAGENIEPILRCLSTVQKIIYEILENEYINDFLRSEFHCKHQIDVLTCGNVQLADILYNETALFYFMEFMELENRRELVDFWMSAINYKQNLMEKGDLNDSAEAQSDAVIIYDKFFSLQATVPLGFSDKIRFQVEQNICQENGKGPEHNCFDIPCKIVYNYLNKYYLPTFLSSQLYYKYLSELINTIQSSPCQSLHPKIKRADSDCSSEISSISMTVSTTKVGATNMNIDSRQLYDPDSLWRRDKYSLSVGYIDELGRFITEIEPDPCRKYESRLTRVVKRLVHMDQDKAKEELAWKIAEMIVREITSLTLGASNLSS